MTEAIPERATISFTVKPFLEKAAISLVTLTKGLGRSSVAVTFAAVESLLPNATV